MIKRSFDVVLSIGLTLVLIPLAILIAISIKFSSKGPVLYWSNRVGKNNQIFLMPKFRTMHINVPVLPTHLLLNPSSYITRFGAFLRKTSLDEIPQLLNIFLGDMSFVGPRPALFSQQDLIELRVRYGVHILTPGLTGWAQINGRDNISIRRKVLLDRVYLKKKSIWLDLNILILTIIMVFKGVDVSH